MPLVCPLWRPDSGSYDYPANSRCYSQLEVLEAAIDKSPGAQAWFIEGLDMWFPNTIKMEIVAPIMDGLQRLATRRNVSVIATVERTQRENCGRTRHRTLPRA